MRIEFFNYWLGSSMKAGGAFPIMLLDLSGDINPSYRYFSLTVLNFGIDVDFHKIPKLLKQ